MIMSPSPSSPTNPNQASSDQLLQELIQISIGPLTELQKKLDMTLDEIVEWMAHRKNRRCLTNLVNIYEVQSQLLLSQQRVLAIARLVQIARDDSVSPETVRRACSDLLRIRLIDPYKEDDRTIDKGPDGLRMPSLGSINAALSRSLGTGTQGNANGAEHPRF